MLFIKLTDKNGKTFNLEYNTPQGIKRMATIYRKNGWNVEEYESDVMPDNLIRIKKPEKRKSDVKKIIDNFQIICYCLSYLKVKL